MKKSVSVLAIAALILLASVLPAFAAAACTGGVEQTSVGALGDAVYNIEVSGTVKDVRYTLYLVKGVYEAVPENVPDNEVLYFTEKFADGESLVFEGVIPKTNDDFTAIAVSDAGAVIVGTFATVEDLPDEPDVPDVPDVPDIPDEPDVPDVPDKPDDKKGIAEWFNSLTPEQLKTLVIGVALGAAALIIIIILAVTFKKSFYR